MLCADEGATVTSYGVTEAASATFRLDAFDGKRGFVLW